MNNKVALGLVAAIIIIGIAFLALGGKHVPATVQIPLGTSTPATETSPAPQVVAPATETTATPKPSAGPTFTPVSSGPVHVATFDQLTFRTTSTHPVVTGKANVKTVGVVIDNPEGVGIAGSFDIPVEDGHWSFPVPVALTPGTYTLHLTGGDNQVNAKLVVAGS